MTALARKMRIEGKTQKDVAEEIGCDQTTVGTWLRAEFRPRPEWHHDLAKYLHLTDEELVDMIEADYRKNDGRTTGRAA